MLKNKKENYLQRNDKVLGDKADNDTMRNILQSLKGFSIRKDRIYLTLVSP